MTYGCYESPLGPLLLEWEEEALTGLWMNREMPEWMQPVPKNVKQWLDAYFLGKPESVESIPILFSGTDFQKQCWHELCRIPYGQTITYKELANRVGTRRGVTHMSCQAVGQAIRKNAFAILIPCHRVIGSNGNLTGYVWGLDFKKELLAHEAKKCCD